MERWLVKVTEQDMNAYIGAYVQWLGNRVGVCFNIDTGNAIVSLPFPQPDGGSYPVQSPAEAQPYRKKKKKR